MRIRNPAIKYVQVIEEAFSSQKRPSNFYKFLSTFVGHFCPPGSGSGFRIRIHKPDWIRIQSGSTTLVPVNPLVGFQKWCPRKDFWGQLFFNDKLSPFWRRKIGMFRSESAKSKKTIVADSEHSLSLFPHLWDVGDEICEGEVVLGGSTPSTSSLHILRHGGQLGQTERQDAHNFPFRGWDLA